LTQEIFLTEVQGYYGPYNGYQLKYVTKWLSHIPEKLYPNLFSEVLKALSPSFRTPPGVSDLDEALRAVRNGRIPGEYIPLQIEEQIDPEEAEAALAELMKTVGACTQKATSWRKPSPGKPRGSTSPGKA